MLSERLQVFQCFDFETCAPERERQRPWLSTATDRARRFTVAPSQVPSLEWLFRVTGLFALGVINFSALSVADSVAIEGSS